MVLGSSITRTPKAFLLTFKDLLVPLNGVAFSVKPSDNGCIPNKAGKLLIYLIASPCKNIPSFKLGFMFASVNIPII